jgi:hypothetical protein
MPGQAGVMVVRTFACSKSPAVLIYSSCNKNKPSRLEKAIRRNAEGVVLLIYAVTYFIVCAMGLNKLK